MTPSQEIAHYVSETAKLYPTTSFYNILVILHLTGPLFHESSSDEFLLGKVKSIYKILKKDQNERQNCSKKN